MCWSGARQGARPRRGSRPPDAKRLADRDGRRAASDGARDRRNRRTRGPRRWSSTAQWRAERRRPAGRRRRGANGGRDWPGPRLDRLPDDIRAAARRTRRRGVGRPAHRSRSTGSTRSAATGCADRIAVYTRDAALLGITADHVPSAAGGATAHRRGPDAAESCDGDRLPPDRRHRVPAA